MCGDHVVCVMIMQGKTKAMSYEGYGVHVRGDAEAVGGNS